MEKRRLGRIGHETSVLVYGAAALGDVTQETADASMAQALDAGINHLDTAASYGEAELRMGPTVERVRDKVFLATKSTERRAEDAWRELNRSLELLHTGHTEQAPVVQAEALRRHDFDSVLTPVTYHLYTADNTFRDNFDILYEMLQDRDVALRTIKAIARKPWVADRALATWYEPFTEPEDIRAAISWVLGTFPYIAGLATAGETTLLGKAIAAEANRMDLAEASAHLALVDDYSTIFVL